MCNEHESISMEGSGKQKLFMGMAPVLMGMESDECLTQELRHLKSQYGIDRFLLIPPPGFAVVEDIRPESFYRGIGKRMKAMKDALSGDGIELGYWCAPTFRMGLSKTCTPMVNLNGQQSHRAYCPLDSSWSAQLIGNITAVAEEFHPFLILLEDDFELSNQPDVNFGCFCQRHLQRFAEQIGRYYSRQELQAEFTRGNAALRREWGKLSKETLVGFARQLRTSIDTVSPESRIGLCQSGCSCFDGDFSLAVSRALAGPRHRPFIRAFGSTYSSDGETDFIGALASFKHYMDAYPEDVDIVHETDSFPHNPFFMSARKLDSLLTCALTYGAKGTLYYALQYLDNPASEPQYLRCWKENLPKWKTIAALIQRQASPVGICRTTYCVDQDAAVPYDGMNRPACHGNPWLDILGRYGFDVTYLRNDDESDAVIFVDVQDLRAMSDADILSLLKRRLVLDGSAADYLMAQGYGDYLGVEIVRDDKPVKFMFERILPQRMTPAIAGEMVYNLPPFSGGTEGGGFVKLVNPEPETEIITDFIDNGESRHRELIGMTLYANSLGGRILITAYDVHRNHSSSIFNPRKMELLSELIEELSCQKMPFRICHSQVFTILRASRKACEFYATLVPLGTDSVSPVICRWRKSPRMIRLLNSNGTWKEVSWENTEGGGVLQLELNRMKPVFLALTFQKAENDKLCQEVF